MIFLRDLVQVFGADLVVLELLELLQQALLLELLLEVCPILLDLLVGNCHLHEVIFLVEGLLQGTCHDCRSGAGARSSAGT